MSTYILVIQWMSFIFFALAALVHIAFFVFESFLLQKPGAYKRLNLTQEQHQAIKPWAFNQGFYNLFLAIGVFVGLSYVLQKKIQMAGLITGFCGMSMLAAGIVLWFSVPSMRKYAYVQAGLPALGFLFLVFHILSLIGQA